MATAKQPAASPPGEHRRKRSAMVRSRHWARSAAPRIATSLPILRGCQNTVRRAVGSNPEPKYQILRRWERPPGRPASPTHATPQWPRIVCSTAIPFGAQRPTIHVLRSARLERTQTVPITWGSYHSQPFAVYSHRSRCSDSLPALRHPRIIPTARPRQQSHSPLPRLARRPRIYLVERFPRACNVLSPFAPGKSPSAAYHQGECRLHYGFHLSRP